jgi:hypothetical protein
VALELLLKSDESILNLLTIITEVFAVDSLIEVLELGQSFRRIVLVSFDFVTPTELPSPTPAPSSKPTGPPTRRPTMAPVPFPTSDSPTKRSTNVPTTPPTREPTFEPTPEESLFECPVWDDWFEGDFEVQIIVSERTYSIGCDGFPTSILALVSDDDGCVRCIGSLVAIDYEKACKDEFGNVNFGFLPPLSDEFIQMYYGYESEFANSGIFIDCPSDFLTLVDPPDGGGGSSGGGGGGGPN